MRKVLPRGADQSRAGDDQRGTDGDVPADELAPAEQQHGEQDAEERLRRDERRDDGDAAAVVRLEEERVRGAEQQPRDEEVRAVGADRAQAHATAGEQYRRQRRRAAHHRGGGRGQRRRLGVGREPPQEVVARREQHRRRQGKDDPDRLESDRAFRLEAEGDAAHDDRQRRGEQQRARGLVERNQRDRDRDERRRPNDERRPRGADVANRTEEEELG